MPGLRPLLQCALLIISIELCASFAAPQSLLHRTEIFAEGGVSYSGSHPFVSAQIFPVGNSFNFITFVGSTSLRTTGRLFVGARFNFTPRDAFEASYSYSPSDVITRGILAQSNPPSITQISTAAPLRPDFWSFNYVRTWSAARRWRPFFTGGIGLGHWSNFFAFKNHFTANLGGGLTYSLTEHWAVRAEYRNFIFPMPGQNSTITYNQIPSVGFVFRF
jgi:opacity protein-like surface antigen